MFRMTTVTASTLLCLCLSGAANAKGDALEDVLLQGTTLAQPMGKHLIDPNSDPLQTYARKMTSAACHLSEDRRFGTVPVGEVLLSCKDKMARTDLQKVEPSITDLLTSSFTRL